MRAAKMRFFRSIKSSGLNLAARCAAAALNLEMHIAAEARVAPLRSWRNAAEWGRIERSSIKCSRSS